jgi:hypothetical protein
MDPDELYREDMPSLWGRVAAGLMFVMGLAFFFMMGWQMTYGPIGSDPAPDVFYIIMGVYMTLLGVLIFNFVTLRISVTLRGVTVGYGRFRYHVAWENIIGYELDRRTSTMAYGGYGLRFSTWKGKAMIVYNIMGAATMILEQKQGRFKYVAFSTKKPDGLMSLIESYRR